MTEDNSNNKSTMTTVKTVYARAALMVMSANLLLTGYAIAALANIQTTDQATSSPQGAQTEQVSAREVSGDKTPTSVEGVVSDKE